MYFRKFTKILAVLSAIITLILPMSYAEAKTTRESDLLKGDVNSDGKVTATDARLALRFSAQLITINDINFAAADFDSSGYVNAEDARKILRFSAKLAPEYTDGTAKPTENTTKAPETQTESKPILKSKIISIPSISQYPEFASGCESVSAVMNLKYYGCDITVEQFIDEYLPIGSTPRKVDGVWYSSDPNESFLGDPTSDAGWGIWAKGLARTIERYLDSQSGKYTVNCTYTETLDSLCSKYIVNNVPVIVWVTAGMEPPYENITARIIGTGKTFTWVSPNHCMLLVGFDETGYYFNDPLTGRREKYTKDESNAAFEANSSQAVIITKH